MYVVNELFIKSIWGNSPCDYSFQPSWGASGGLIIVWDCSRVVVWSTMSFDHVLVIKGKDIQSEEEFVIFNIYAPCDLATKSVIWARLTPLIVSNNDVCLCVCGDFNSVRDSDERKGRGTMFRQVDADVFNKFINDGSLVDLPICGRLFTWYRGDGVSMSRLDRFLLSENWCEAWPNFI